MRLNELGWNPFFESLYEDVRPTLGPNETCPARVIRQHRGSCGLDTGERLLAGTLPGKALFDGSDLPAVGDWVAAEPLPGEDKAIIRAVLPRRGQFVRQAAGETSRVQIVAANVDTVFLVSGLDHDFNPRRIERYLTLAWDSGAAPVILLNKADLCPAVEQRVAEAEAIAVGAPVHAVSALGQPGLASLAPYLVQGKTIAFLGSSGVGKSSLVNRLLGRQRMATSTVREDDSRGRHTTTHRELVVLPGGAALIDTPGMRELQLTGGASLGRSFADIQELAEQCRYRDCTHKDEPGCAVHAAITEGVLDPKRLASFRKQLREAAFAERRQSDAASRENRAYWKKIAKQHKAFYRDNPKGSK